LGDETRVDTAIISPYKKAVIGAQVAGVISGAPFEEGDLVKKGQVVFQISDRRFKAIAARAAGRLEAAERKLEGVQREAAIKGKLLKKGAITQQEMIRAESAVEIALAESREAAQALKLAEMDVKACRVRAPFTGYINKLLKHNHEPVARLEELFEIVDTSRVFAVANVPEKSLEAFGRNTGASFAPASGSEPVAGKVHRLGKSLDPSSNTKKVYVLIDNPEATLEIGMSGSLKVKK
jgi:RND family efflux transporter MFP subunit